MPSSNNRFTCWRARRLTDKQWIYGQLLQFGDQGCIFVNPNENFPIDITTKGQSIGKLDKNGKNVYEGDLILATEDGVQDVYVVVHRGCGFVGKHYNSEKYIDLATHDMDVVGQYYTSDLERELQEIKSKLNLLAKKGESGEYNDNNKN